MKHTLVFLLIIMLILIACHKKGLPEITQRESSPPLRAADTTKVIPDEVVGSKIYTNRCGKCHGLPVVEQYASTKWDTIIALMSPRARLSREQEVHILAYVKANAVK
jgi:cytochrome c5